MDGLDSGIAATPQLCPVISRDIPHLEPDVRISRLLLHEFSSSIVGIAAYIDRNGFGFIPENLVICRSAGSVRRNRPSVKGRNQSVCRCE